MIKFKDKVIALTDSPAVENCQYRKKGSVYIVEATDNCPFCFMLLINIGQSTKLARTMCKCGELLGSGGKLWTPYTEFVLLDKKDQALQEALQVEDYEFAAKLRDL